MQIQWISKNRAYTDGIAPKVAFMSLNDKKLVLEAHALPGIVLPPRNGKEKNLLQKKRKVRDREEKKLGPWCEKKRQKDPDFAIWCLVGNIGVTKKKGEEVEDEDDMDDEADEHDEKDKKPIVTGRIKWAKGWFSLKQDLMYLGEALLPGVACNSKGDVVLICKMAYKDELWCRRATLTRNGYLEWL